MATPINTGTYLDLILANTASELEARKRETSLPELEQRIADLPAPVSFAGALRGPGVSLIAEIKRASPSKGLIAGEIDVVEIAEEYLDGGASAISVLTDQIFFQGSLDDLTAVAAVAHTSHSRPVLRKDFVIDSYQIVEARAAGADAILLIVAALDDRALAELYQAARSLGLGVLVEVHDDGELERALKIAPGIIGINNRNLRTFEVDLGTTERLADRIPAGIVKVGESGIHTPEDLDRLAHAGVNAVLVGESLMRQTDRAEAVRKLLGS